MPISLKLMLHVFHCEAPKLKVHIQSSEALKLKVCTQSSNALNLGRFSAHLYYMQFLQKNQ